MPIRLGCIVPKRHARRAVTRSLIKRQIRAVLRDRASGLAPGLWLVRLKAPIDRREFPSAASESLRRRLRAELIDVIVSAASHVATRHART